MTVEINAVCDMGRQRQNNEDMVLAGTAFLRNAELDWQQMELGTEPVLFAVSDGMGGHNAGEQASEFVLRRMDNLLRAVPAGLSEEQIKHLLDEKIPEVHQQLNQVGNQNPTMKGMGCTFTGFWYYSGQFYFIHVGDSRLYRLRGKYIAQLTRDHSLQKMLNNASIPANHIGNCFGGGVSAFFYDFENLHDRVLPEDTFLLCSDGLNGELEDEVMEELLLSGSAAGGLVAKANELGGRDNISCLVVRVG